jgi:hypothetical protein
MNRHGDYDSVIVLTEDDEDMADAELWGDSAVENDLTSAISGATPYALSVLLGVDAGE